MKGGVLGVLCLLAFQLSLGKSEYSDEITQLEESDKLLKLSDTEPDLEEYESRRFNNELNNTNKLPDDLKSKLDVSTIKQQNATHLEDTELKSSKEASYFEDLHSSAERSNSELSTEAKSITTGSLLAPQQALLKHYNYLTRPTERAVELNTHKFLFPEDQHHDSPKIQNNDNLETASIPRHSQTLSTNDNTAELSQDVDNVSLRQVQNYFPSIQDSDKTVKLIPTFNQETVGLNSNSKSELPTIPKEPSATTNGENVFIEGLDLYPPLYAAHLAAEAASANKETNQESHFSPLFSSPDSSLSRSGYDDTQAQNDREDTRDSFNEYNVFLPNFQPNYNIEKSERRQLTNNDQKNKAEFKDTDNAYAYSPIENGSDHNETDEMRSGDPSYINVYNNAPSTLNAYSLSSHAAPVSIPGNAPRINSLAQWSPAHLHSSQSSQIEIEDVKSRVIWPHEYIFPHKLPGGDKIQCSKENEFHHFWSNINCLVCICLNNDGILEPVCASCSGCLKTAPVNPGYFEEPPAPSPKPYAYIPEIPLPVPNVPYVPLPNIEPSVAGIALVQGPDDLQPSTVSPMRKVSASCRPLPSGQPFTNPLHPCQICICREIKTFGKIDVRIECHDSPHCVLPSDVTTLPPVPDVPVPVPLPLCKKFPPHVKFPHPIERCKECVCSTELSHNGIPEQRITCNVDTHCIIGSTPRPVSLIVSATPSTITPPAPPIPIPVQFNSAPVSKPIVKPIPQFYSSTILPPVAPLEMTEKPLSWPPVSTPAPPRGPLPGPPPHESCRPFPANQPFQHPWDECKVCQCSEIKTISVINVEVNCYTKKSCCIEPPEDLISVKPETILGQANKDAAVDFINGPQHSTIKPPVYSPELPQIQPLYGINGHTQNFNENLVPQLPSTTNLGYNTPIQTQHNYLNSLLGSHSLHKGSLQNQAYSDFKTNALIDGISNNKLLIGINNFPTSFNPYISDISQKEVTSGNLPAHQQLAPISTKYKPAAPYSPYNPISQSQAYSEINKLGLKSVPTIKPPSLYSLYNQKNLQSINYADAYNGFLNITPKPPDGLTKSKSPSIFGSDIYQNPVYGKEKSTNKDLYDKPALPYYNDYNLPDSYRGNAFKHDLTLGNDIMQAYAQTVPLRGSLLTNYLQSPGYQYLGGYNTGLIKPRSVYPENQHQHGLTQVGYGGNYELNGKPDTMSIYNPNNIHSSGFGQGMLASNLYSSLFPSLHKYGMKTLFHSGQSGSSSGQGLLLPMQTKSGEPEQKELAVPSQTKSGEGLPEDSDGLE